MSGKKSQRPLSGLFSSRRRLVSRRRWLGPAWLQLALVGLSVAYATVVSAQLVWDNSACPGIECPQRGTPQGACECGFWKDSPGSVAPNGETVFVFVESVSPGDETGVWRAALREPVTDRNIFRVRAAANDSSVLTINAYENLGGNFQLCSGGAARVATLQWGPNDDNSRFSTKAVAYVGTIAGLCIKLTDDPNGANPVSRRTSAQVDYIELEEAASGAVVTLESFQLPQ